jgi:hypothetical protein
MNVKTPEAYVLAHYIVENLAFHFVRRLLKEERIQNNFILTGTEHFLHTKIFS